MSLRFQHYIILQVIFDFLKYQQCHYKLVPNPFWLVVYLPLWKMMEFVSWGQWDDEIPNMMGKSYKIPWFQTLPNHQPAFNSCNEVNILKHNAINHPQLGMASPTLDMVLTPCGRSRCAPHATAWGCDSPLESVENEFDERMWWHQNTVFFRGKWGVNESK